MPTPDDLTPDAPAAPKEPTKTTTAWATQKKTQLHVFAGAAVYAGWAEGREVTEAQFDAGIKAFLGLSFGHVPASHPDVPAPKKVTVFDRHVVGGAQRPLTNGKKAAPPSSNPAVAAAQAAAPKNMASQRWARLQVAREQEEKARAGIATAKATPKQ